MRHTSPYGEGASYPSSVERNMNQCDTFCATPTRYNSPYAAIPYRTATIAVLTTKLQIYSHFAHRRRGRVAEGGGLLNRYTLIRRIEGSNPSVSASH
jgi:hypothetical protein